MVNENRIYLRGELIEGRYIVDEVRRGMMGVVYLCKDAENNAPVAIKTFEDRYLNSEENRKLFLEEMVVWIQLDSHPNIVRAYSVKIIDEKPHLFMERVIGNNPRGATLKDYLFTKMVQEKDMLQIGVHICKGMIHAIGQFPDLVHRDLKSENILLGEDTIPKISDFGMTMKSSQYGEKIFDSEGSFNPKILARHMIGTPAFSSPEQCLCKKIDTRSDIYSVGCILYHLVTKRLPFHKATVEETIVAQVKEKPIEPIRIDPSLSKDSSDLILACLRKNPGERISSFSELFERLRRIYANLFTVNPVSFTQGKPVTAEERVDRALSFVLLGRFSAASKEFDLALQLKPNDPAILFQLGKLRFMQNRFDEALIFLGEAYKKMPNHYPLLEMLGKTYVEKSMLEKALFYFKNLMNLSRDNETGYRELAKIYIKQGKDFLAEEVLKKGILCCARKSNLYVLLAELFRSQNLPLKEKEILLKYYQEKPGDFDTIIRLGEIAFATGAKRDSLEWIKKAMEKNIVSFRSWYRAGKLFLDLHDTQHALEAWAEAANTGDGDALFHRGLADLYFEVRDYESAWTHALRSEDLGGDVEELKRKIQAKRLRWH